MTTDVRARDAERLLADVQRLTGAGYWEWDVAADRITWSRELYGLFGVDPDRFEATYDHYLELLHPEDRDLVAAAVAEATRTGEDYSVEHRIVRPDGEVRWILGRGAVEVQGGAVVRVFGVAIDVTDRMREDERLRHFVTNAAHELRTPVAALSTAVELLDGAATPEERAQVTDALGRQAARLRELSEDLLTLSAVDSGPTSVSLRPHALLPIVDRAAAHSRVPGLVVDVPSDLVVQAAGTELEIALTHLLANAREHGGPSIRLSAYADAHDVVITVSDDGDGVPASVRDDLFVPFARGRGRTSHGSGLGLAIVRRLVVMQRGAVSYDPGPEGGAMFTVRLGAA